MNKIQPKRATDLAIDTIRSAILEGKWTPGECLPPERALAETLGINRQTLRSALSRLESEGLVKPWHGHGVVVQDWRETGALILMSWTGNARDISDLMMIRRTLAAEAIAKAAIHATTAHRQKLRDIAHQQDQTTNPNEFLTGDLAFIRTLVEASASLPLKLLFNTIAKISLANPTQFQEMLSDQAAARSSYRALISLVHAQKPELARRAVLQVLREEDHAQLAKILR